MIGITSYGIYVPYNRLDRKHLSDAFGKKSLPGEKAVANYDEDSLTMSVAAARNCLSGKNENLDAIFFASTTSPNKDKQSAAHLASVLDMEGNMRTADFGGSLRSGASAILSAIDLAKHGENTLVAAADCRLGVPDSVYEAEFGDGAAAICFGNENVIAEYVDSFSAAHDFYDVWRDRNDTFVRSFDERFSLSEAFVPFVLESIKGVLEKTGLKQEDFSKVIIDASNAKRAATIIKKSGFSQEQVCQSLINDFGYSGTAYAPTLLAGALEQSKAGDLILYVSYGEGSDAIVFKVAKESKPERDVAYYKEHKRNTMNYEKYLRWKQMMEFGMAKRPPFTRSSLPDFYRKRKKNLACYGSVCTKCNTPHFPPSRICVSCQAIDEMEFYPFLDKKAKIATFSIDYLAYSLDSPNIVVVLDFEGGGRMFTNLVDCDLENVAIDMPVTLIYRKMYSADGIDTYFWKCVPATHER